MKNKEMKGNAVYREQEERIILPEDEGKLKEETVFKLKDIISCLNLCEDEIQGLKKKLSGRINLLE